MRPQRALLSSPPSGWLSSGAVARAAGVTSRTITSYAARGLIQALLIEGRWYFPPQVPDMVRARQVDWTRAKLRFPPPEVVESVA